MVRVPTVVFGKALPMRHRVLAWVGLLALVVGVGGSLGRSVWTFARLRSDARRAVAAGRYGEGRALLERWLKREPDSPEAHYLKARVGLGTDRPGEVADGLKRARALGHPGSELDLLLAVIDAKKGRHGEAEPVLARAFAGARGPDPLVDEALAKVYIETFQFARAEPVLDRWSREDPGNAKPYLWRVEIDRRKADDPGAVVRDYREAVKRAPNLAEARLGLADELRLAHRCAEAGPEYDAYLARKPDDPAGRLGAGRNALELGDEAAAVRHLARVLELDPGHAGAHRELAEIDLRRGENARALAHLDRAAGAEPNDVRVRYSRALALSRLGRSEAAEAERALVARLREDEVQIDRLRRRLVTSPHDAALQCQAARWMFQHGHADEGVRWAEKALRDRPGDPEVSRLLADHYRRSGNPGLANFYRLYSPARSGGAPPAP